VVIDGKIELAIDGKTRIYSRGDTYFIPAGTKHSARIHPGFRAFDFFADKDRYSTS
jgi:quercetin dioxygenase-like cupin family protein